MFSKETDPPSGLEAPLAQEQCKPRSVKRTPRIRHPKDQGVPHAVRPMLLRES